MNAATASVWVSVSTALAGIVGGGVAWLRGRRRDTVDLTEAWERNYGTLLARVGALQTQLGQESEARLALEGKLARETEARRSLESKLARETEARMALEAKLAQAIALLSSHGVPFEDR